MQVSEVMDISKIASEEEAKGFADLFESIAAREGPLRKDTAQEFLKMCLNNL